MIFFVISTGTLDQSLEFTQRINEVHLSIKLDFKFSNKEIDFLDTVVYKTPTRKLESKLHAKDSDQQPSLNHKSEHYQSLNAIYHLSKCKSTMYMYN